FQAEDGIRDRNVTGVQTCALPICLYSAQEVMRRCDLLGAITDEPGRLMRTFHSPGMQRANQLVGEWMRKAGLSVREDAAFNLIRSEERRVGKECRSRWRP